MLNQRRKIAVLADVDVFSVWHATTKHIDLLLKNFDVEIYLKRGFDKKVVGEKYLKYVYEWITPKDFFEIIKNRDDIEWIWQPTALSILRHWRIKFLAHKKIIFWVQGSIPDESYMRNHSLIRKAILKCAEYVAFAMTTRAVYVSNAMRNFYENKGIKIKSVVIPCLCDAPNVKVASTRIPNSFVYIGGLSVWQCFEEMLNIYKAIRTQTSILHVITLETNVAEHKISEIFGAEHSDIKVYTITDRTKIPEVLSKFQYGFLLRKVSPVNEVASPIKFLEYISNGVNVIMTDAVRDYATLVNKESIGTIVDLNNTNITINPYNHKAEEVYRRRFNNDKFAQKYVDTLV